MDVSERPIPQKPIFEIFACNWQAVRWFFEHQTGIWRYGFNGIESMDYGQIKAAIDLERTDDDELNPADLFKKLRLIERGFMGEVNRQRAEEARKRK